MAAIRRSSQKWSGIRESLLLFTRSCIPLVFRNHAAIRQQGERNKRNHDNELTHTGLPAGEAL